MKAINIDFGVMHLVICEACFMGKGTVSKVTKNNIEKITTEITTLTIDK